MPNLFGIRAPTVCFIGHNLSEKYLFIESGYLGFEGRIRLGVKKNDLLGQADWAYLAFLKPNLANQAKLREKCKTKIKWVSDHSKSGNI